MTLQPAIPLDFDFKILNTKTYGTISLKFAAQVNDKDNSGYDVPMIPDFSEPNIFVGDKDKLNWGAECHSNGENKCDRLPSGEEPCSRRAFPSQEATCYKADTYLRFISQTIPDGCKKLTVNFISQEKDIIPKSVGYLGLAPKSPFWTYVSGSVDNGLDYMDVSFFYRVNSLDNLVVIDNKNYKNAMTSMNGNAIAKQPDFIEVDNKRDFWLIENAFIAQVDKEGLEQKVATKTCVTNQLNATIAISNYADYKTDFFFRLCKKTPEQGCNQSEINPNFLDDFKFYFYNATTPDKQVEIGIQAIELFYFD